jgi:flavin-binding protein dodecin
MAEPFERRSAQSEGVLERLGVRRPRAAALHAVEDALAGAQDLLALEEGALARVAAAEGAELSALRTGCLQLYRRFLEHCFADQALSEDESRALDHLRTLLRLGEADVAPIHHDVAQRVYGHAIDAVLEDQRLDPEEERFLRRLRGELRLSEGEARALLDEGAERARQRFIEQSISRDSFLLRSTDVVLDLTGSSSEGLEAAVRSTLDQAVHAIPDLRWIELDQIAADLEEGRVARWHVKLKARRSQR